MGDTIVVDGCLVSFLDGPSVDGEEINVVAFEDFEELVEFLLRFETYPGFDGERRFATGFPKSAQNFVNLIRMTKEPATGILAIDNGGGAAQVEVDSGDGVIFEVAGGSGQFGGILTDHLGDDGFFSRVFRD